MAIVYNVFRDGEKVASEIEDKTYTDTGLEPGTSYDYQVSALDTDTGLESEKSEVFTIQTEEEEEEAPDAPQGLSGVSTEDTVTLDWE